MTFDSLSISQLAIIPEILIVIIYNLYFKHLIIYCQVLYCFLIIIKIPAADIREVVPQDVSIMPSSFPDDLTVQEFHDVLSYVTSLTGEEPTEEEESDDDEEDEESDENDEETSEEPENEKG